MFRGARSFVVGRESESIVARHNLPKGNAAGAGQRDAGGTVSGVSAPPYCDFCNDALKEALDPWPAARADLTSWENRTWICLLFLQLVLCCRKEPGRVILHPSCLPECQSVEPAIVPIM